MSEGSHIVIYMICIYIYMDIYIYIQIHMNITWGVFEACCILQLLLFCSHCCASFDLRIIVHWCFVSIVWGVSCPTSTTILSNKPYRCLNTSVNCWRALIIRASSRLLFAPMREPPNLQGAIASSRQFTQQSWLKTQRKQYDDMYTHTNPNCAQDTPQFRWQQHLCQTMKIFLNK